ncbi:MAG: FG-GAP-like repeat-containing protein [Planctomycetota bacterium]
MTRSLTALLPIALLLATGACGENRGESARETSGLPSPDPSEEPAATDALTPGAGVGAAEAPQNPSAAPASGPEPAGEREGSVDSLYQLARTALDGGQISRAVQLLHDVLAQDPSHHGALFWLARLYDRRQMYPQAKPLYERALKVQPNHVPTLLSYAIHSMSPTNAQDWERARQLIERAIEQQPENANAQFTMGSYWFRTAQYEKAFKTLERALELDPRSPDVLQHLGATSLAVGKPAEAATYYRRVLDESPTLIDVKWQLALADERAGINLADEKESHRLNERAESDTDPGFRFVDVAEKAQVGGKLAGRASAWLDYDNDGWLDLLTATSYFPVALYRNMGDGTFRDVTEKAGLSSVKSAWGAVAADFDNDGDQDLFITRNGWLGAMSNSLLRNDGDGTFTEVTAEAGVADPNCSGFAASVADIDRDGLLDIYVSNISPYDDAPNRLYHNLGGLKFEEIAAQAGVQVRLPSIGCAFGDYDQDGWPDLYVGNYSSDNCLFHNEQDLTFRNVTNAMTAAAPLLAFVCFLFDADNDGDLDLFCSAYATYHDFAVSAADGKPVGTAAANTLLRNDGQLFTPLTFAAGFKRSYGTMAANFGDFDGDGNFDVFCANGGPEVGRFEPNAAYLGDGKGNFVEVARTTGLRYVGKSHGVSVADFDLDGCVDVFVPCGGAFIGDLEPSHLYLLEGKQPEPAIVLRLEGVTSNRDAVGTQVLALRASDSQLQEVTAGVGFGCTNSKEIIIHLPQGKPAALHIRWPSGKRHQFENVQAGRYRLREDGEGLFAYPKPSPPMSE